MIRSKPSQTNKLVLSFDNLVYYFPLLVIVAYRFVAFTVFGDGAPDAGHLSGTAFVHSSDECWRPRPSFLDVWTNRPWGKTAISFITVAGCPVGMMGPFFWPENAARRSAWCLAALGNVAWLKRWHWCLTRYSPFEVSIRSPRCRSSDPSAPISPN